MDFHRSFQRNLTDVEGYHGEYPIYGDTELKEARDNIIFRIRSVKMGNGKHDSAFDMSDVWDEL